MATSNLAAAPVSARTMTDMFKLLAGIAFLYVLIGFLHITAITVTPRGVWRMLLLWPFGYLYMGKNSNDWGQKVREWIMGDR